MLSNLASRRGAALPMAILWTMLLAVGLVAGLGRLSAERRTQVNHQAEVDAYSLARAGLDRYFEVAAAQPGATFDTTITGLPGGSAAVSVRRLRAASGSLPALYLIRSHATQSAGVRYDPLTGSAQRSVTQFAVWQPGTMNVLAAWTSISGNNKNGNSGTISGNNNGACGGVAAAAPVAGAAVPTSPGLTGHTGPFSGSPPIANLGANPAAMAANINIDWNGIVNGGALIPQYTPTGSSGWPPNYNSWPTIYVNNGPTGTVAIPSGQGLLVIRGNATISGSNSWNGVILVGGNLTSNGNNTVLGAVVSGLNIKLGENVPQGDVGNGNKTFQYCSTYVANALANLGGLVAVRNSLGDNWPVY